MASVIEKELAAEIRQRKNIGQQAKHRKCGKRSKKCSLPSDHMTKKQLKGLSGECMTYNLSKPMKWEEFKYMPKDLQKQYLKKLHDDYCADTRCAAEMFGIARGSLLQWMNRHDISGAFPPSGGKRPEWKEAKWQAFLRGETAQQPEAQEQQPVTLVAAEQPAEAVQQPQMVESEAQPGAVNVPRQPRMKCQTTFTMHCTGPFDIYDFVMELGKFIEEGQPVEIMLTGTINPETAREA